MPAKRQPMAIFGLALLLGCVLILTSQTGTAYAGPNGDGIVYVVQPGDRLVDIAARYGVTASALVRANGLANPDTIFVGQRLTIPGSSVSTPTPGGSSGATPDAGRSVTYSVQRGDTLAAIARKYGVSMAALQQANGLKNPNLIWVGQRLVITGDSTAVTQAPTPTAVNTVSPQPTLAAPATTEPTIEPAVSPPSTAETPATAQPTPEPSATAQPTAAKPPTAQPTAKPAVPATHIVQAGETLSQIARQYGVSVDALVARNGLASADLIQVGMRLVIPAKGSGGGGGGTVSTAPQGKATKFVASISQQRCWLYSGTTVIAQWVCSTGRRGAGTKVGTFRVQSKMDKAYGSRWNIWMPYWLGIYYAGGSENGIHGLPWNASTGVQIWSGNVGTPITYGCVMLNNTNAKTLYDMAYIGMPVVVRP